MLLLLSQAIFGGSILQIKIVPQWVDWATVVWNPGWFVLLFRAKDPYYLALYYMIPLLIGVSLMSLAK